MTTLDLSNKKLLQIPKNIDNKYLKLLIHNNKISKIENIKHLTKLKYLVLDKNFITHLENLPSNLKILFIRFNNIKKLEKLPPNLTILWIGNNQISKLENLPHNLYELNLYGNVINNPINTLNRYQRWNRYKWIYFRLRLSGDYNKFICYYLYKWFYNKK